MTAVGGVKGMQFVAGGEIDDAVVDERRPGALDVDGPRRCACFAVDRSEVLAIERDVDGGLVHRRCGRRREGERDPPGFFSGEHWRHERLELLRTLTAVDVVRAEAPHN